MTEFQSNLIRECVDKFAKQALEHGNKVLTYQNVLNKKAKHCNHCCEWFMLGHHLAAQVLFEDMGGIFKELMK